MSKILTRYGDNYVAEMTEEEIRQDIEDGTLDASERAEIPTLTKEEVDYLYEIIACPQKNRVCGTWQRSRGFLLTLVR